MLTFSLCYLGWEPLTTGFQLLNYLVTTTLEEIELIEIAFFSWIRRKPHHFNN